MGGPFKPGAAGIADFPRTPRHGPSRPMAALAIGIVVIGKTFPAILGA